MTEQKPILRLKRQRRLSRDDKPISPGTGRAGRGGKRVGLGASPGASLKPVRKVTPVDRAVSEQDLLAKLQSMAPEVWDAAQPLPLAVGIHLQLNPVAESKGLSRRFVRRFLGHWTSSPAYLIALSRPGARRFNADGSGAEDVHERHGCRARLRLQKRQPAANEAAVATGNDEPDPVSTPA